jgi:hypothetical protein
MGDRCWGMCLRRRFKYKVTYITVMYWFGLWGYGVLYSSSWYSKAMQTLDYTTGMQNSIRCLDNLLVCLFLYPPARLGKP